MTNCAFPGCRNIASKGPAGSRTTKALCPSHRSRQRRHGNVLQRTISPKELKAYDEIIGRRLKAFPSAKAWPVLDARWNSLVERARQGTAHLEPDTLPRNNREAAYCALVDIGKTAQARSVWQRVASFFLFRSHNPGAFVDEKAFLYQIVRSVRKLGSASFGRRRNRTTGQVKQWQRDLPPKVSEHIGQLIIEYLGVAGVYLTDLERKTADREEQEKRDLETALEELKHLDKRRS